MVEYNSECTVMMKKGGRKGGAGNNCIVQGVVEVAVLEKSVDKCPEMREKI